jgi:hypothetical protein
MAYSKEDIDDKKLIKLLEKLDMSKEVLSSIPFADNSSDEDKMSDTDKLSAEEAKELAL